MCQKCNEALIAASQAALSLSMAAKQLYDMNASKQADTLAKAAAELFEIVELSESATIKEEVSARAEADTAAANTADMSAFESLIDAIIGRPSKNKDAAFRMGEDGVLYVNGVAIARAVVINGPKPTKH